MKAICSRRGFGALILLISCGLWNALAESEIHPGDSREQVISLLGEPQGSVQMETAEWLLYPRGKLRLVEGRVIESSLLSPEAFQEQQEIEQRLQAQKEKRERIERQERIRKGRTVKDRILTDAGYFSKSADERIQIWSTFQQQYPEVDVRSELSLARRDQERDARQAVQSRQISDLEFRVALAEERALEAERASRRRRSFEYPVLYPIVYSCNHRPSEADFCHPQPVPYGISGQTGYGLSHRGSLRRSTSRISASVTW